MSVVRSRFILPALITTGLMAVGCGQTALDSPTAPSATAASSLPNGGDLSAGIASTGDVSEALKGNDGKGGKDNEHGRGGDNGNEKEKENGDKPKDKDEAHNSHGELSGFVIAKGTDTLTVRGVTVKVTADTFIRHGHTKLALADI